MANDLSFGQQQNLIGNDEPRFLWKPILVNRIIICLFQYQLLFPALTAVVEQIISHKVRKQLLSLQLLSHLCMS